MTHRSWLAPVAGLSVVTACGGSATSTAVQRSQPSAAVVNVTNAPAAVVPDWHHVDTPVAPLPRNSGGFAYDAATQTVLLSGGRRGCGPDATAYQDTWTWTGTAWTQQHPSNNGPAGLTHFTLSYDEVSRQVIAVAVVSGCGVLAAMYFWDGTQWTKSDPAVTLPPPMFDGVTAFDAASGQLLLFGTPYIRDGGPASTTQTWSWNGHSWRQRSVASPPPRLNAPAMAYDPATKQVVLFGGSLETDQTVRGPAQDATWTWDGVGWKQVAASPHPSARSGASMAYDQAAGSMILFGGGDATATFNDTWSWDGSAWTQLHPATVPEARMLSHMAYDAQTRQLVLFGGALTPDADANDTWVYGTA